MTVIILNKDGVQQNVSWILQSEEKYEVGMTISEKFYHTKIWKIKKITVEDYTLYLHCKKVK